MTDQFPRTIPRAQLPDFSLLASILIFFLGWFLVNHFGFAFYEKCRITAWELMPFVLGILLCAWAPSFRLQGKLRNLEARIRTLEGDQKRAA